MLRNRLGQVRDKPIRHLSRAAQRDKVATVDLVRHQAQPLRRYAEVTSEVAASRG